MHLHTGIQQLEGAIRALLSALNSNPLVIIFQYHALIPCLLLGSLWFLSGIIRRREIHRLNTPSTSQNTIELSPKDATSPNGNTNRQSHIPPPPSSTLPGLAVILPTKGIRPHTFSNWNSILDIKYNGHIQYLFVLEDTHDPVLPHLKTLIKRHHNHNHHKQQPKLPPSHPHPQPPSPSIDIVIAGHTTKCSQKIHNIIKGIKSVPTSTCTYVVCIDDDVHLHPDALSRLVTDMEADPSLFMATGYPFDIPSSYHNCCTTINNNTKIITKLSTPPPPPTNSTSPPPPTSSIWTYCAMAYHLPLVIAFSIKQRTHFVWGGCMLFRLTDLLQGTATSSSSNGSNVLQYHNLLDVWQQGGYSDDLTVAARCTELSLPIHCPSYSIFPQWVGTGRSGGNSSSSDDGNSDDASEGHMMMMPMVQFTTAKHWWNYLRRQLFVLDTYSNAHCKMTNHIMAVVHVYASLAFVIPAALVAIQCSLWTLIAILQLLRSSILSSSSLVDPNNNNASSLLSSYSSLLQSPSILNNNNTIHPSLWICLASVIYMSLGLHYMTVIIITLMSKLNPSLSSPAMHAAFHWPRMLLGLWLSNAVIPVCMVYTFIKPSIVWSGVMYKRSGGKVVGVDFEGREDVYVGCTALVERCRNKEKENGGGGGVLRGGVEKKAS